MSAPEHTGEVFIIIPYYNEPDVIRQVIDGLVSFSNIIVVDDGSHPPLQNQWKGKVAVLRHRVNLGQGAAIQTGVEYGLRRGGKYFVTFDADGQHDPSDIDTLLRPLFNDSADIVLGSRFLPGSAEPVPPGRKRLLMFSRFINYLFTGLYLSDAHNGLRAFTSQAAGQIRFRENRMAHATEILSIIRKKKLRFREVPVNVRYTEYSKRKGQRPANSIRIFFDLVLHKLFE